MDQLKEWAIQYTDGLITAREFIQQAIHALIMHSYSMHEIEDELANQLATLLVSHEKT